MSADQRITAAAEFLDHARKHRAEDLPAYLLERHYTELRRQLGTVLNVVAEMSADMATLRRSVSAGVFDLGEEESALVLDALEVAAEYRRYRADLSCVACARSQAGLCDDHAADIERAEEYAALARQIRRAGL